MRTQNLLNTIRLLTYTILISLVAYSATANTKTDSALFSGEGEGKGEEATQEERIELEQWMLKRDNFSVSETNKESKTNEGHPLKSWMLDESNFQIKDNNELEDWMMKRKCFKTEEIRDFGLIKDWMLSKNSFII